MQGLHILAELHSCQCPIQLLTTQSLLQQLALKAARDAGLSVVSEQWHTFAPHLGQTGVTGVVLLAESHMAIHTWPEIASVSLDIYVCNFSEDNSHKARLAFETLQTALMPNQTQLQNIQRGVVPSTDAAHRDPVAA